MRSFAFAAVIGATNAITAHDFDYLSYMAKYNKVVGDVEEFAMRVQNFRNTHAFIQEHNNSNASWVAGHNQFSDWTREEIKGMLGGEAPVFDEDTPVFTPESLELPSSVNWVDAGAVNPVQDQAQCGSCYAFSSAGALEAAHFRQSGNRELLKFSEQQLVDCTGEQSPWGNKSCIGGSPVNIFKYLQQNNIMTEASYPYTSGASKVAGQCQYNPYSATPVRVAYWQIIPHEDIYMIKSGVAQQPVSISIEGDKQSFLSYKSGIFDSQDCGTETDHVVLIVGYGSENGQEYWLVKNSWNTTWGEDGYVRIAIVPGKGICGTQMYPVFPMVTM